MSAPTQFRKKPVVISAIQWTGENLVDVIHFTDGRPPNNKSSHAGMMWDQYVDLVRKDGLKIFTMEGKMDASIGDWIIKGVKGEHYPCKPEIFALTYEDASASTDLSQAAVAAALEAAANARWEGHVTDNSPKYLTDWQRGLVAGQQAFRAAIHAMITPDQRTTLQTAIDAEVAKARAEDTAGSGVYIASKTTHAAKWIALREAGYPICSTWIDEAGVGATGDWPDLWTRCISEASSCAALVAYREPGETLKGAWSEVGAALAKGRKVYLVGDFAEFSIRHHPNITLFEGTVEAALAQIGAKP